MLKSCEQKFFQNKELLLVYLDLQNSGLKNFQQRNAIKLVYTPLGHVVDGSLTVLYDPFYCLHTKNIESLENIPTPWLYLKLLRLITVLLGVFLTKLPNCFTPCRRFMPNLLRQNCQIVWVLLCVDVHSELLCSQLNFNVPVRPTFKLLLL